MPTRPASPCGNPACPKLRPCPDHELPDYRTERTVGLSTAERGYGPAWRQLRAQVLAEEPRCQLCGASATDVDHITPKARGGGDERSNLRALCRRCHMQETGAIR